MNVPNILTLLRIFFVPLLVAMLLADDLSARWQAWIPAARDLSALAIFLAAASTDLLDGYLARRWKQVTTVGTLLDPIADKLLISATLITLVETHRVPAWIVIVIVGREFAVDGLRSIAAASGYIIRASELGKTKMIAQVAAVSLVIVAKRWPALDEYGLVAMWAVMLFGLVSAADYFRNFWRKVETEVKVRRRRELLRLERTEQRLAKRQRRAARRSVTETRELAE